MQLDRTPFAANAELSASPPMPGRAARILRRLLLHAGFVVIAVIAYVAHEHFRLNGQSRASLASLVVAAGFGFAPLRLVAHELLAIEGKIAHLAHGLGGLALIGLTAGGVVSGGPLLSHGAMAPFAIMGAAQALMHQNRPRSREQADAMRAFATSIPEVAQFTSSRDLASPANVRRAVAVLTDLIGKAEALGETELRSDPGFQAALRRATARCGLSLGLDAADRAIGKLESSPAGARAAPDLRRKLAAARKSLASEGTAPAEGWSSGG